ncbi:MAG: lysoplasmalogenase family protein [Oliverpabstia sp.]
MLHSLWIASAVPVIAAGCTLHCKMKDQDEKKWSILPKCIATWMVVCTAAIGIMQQGNISYSVWILYAMICFLLADGLLVVHFLAGMGVFAVGHILLLVWLIMQGHWNVWYLLVWLLGMILVLLIFRDERKHIHENPMILLMILYAGVLMAMVTLALMLPIGRGSQYIGVAIGATLFAGSDMMVGKGFFHKLSKKTDFFCLALYYSGIFFLSMGTW